MADEQDTPKEIDPQQALREAEKMLAEDRKKREQLFGEELQALCEKFQVQLSHQLVIIAR